MKDIMMKLCGGLILIGALVLACSQVKKPHLRELSLKPQFNAEGYWQTENVLFKKNADNSISYYGTNSLYGPYLAARVAHMRQDFDDAAEYYKIVMQKDPGNARINRSVYLILSALGQIDNAAPYAQKEIDSGEKKSLAPLIIALNNFTDGKYEQARKQMSALNEPAYKTIINPLFNAWTYVGEKDEKNAIASINKIVDDPLLETMKLFHKALIYDYLGNKEKATECFAQIVQNHPKDVTYRVLEIITNFYVRNGDKEMAHKISGRYNDRGLLALLLKDIDKKIENGSINTEAVINSPRKGLAEAMFNIGTIFRASTGGTEYAQIYIAASSFLNPDYDLSQIALANVLEEIGLLKEANRYYAKIPADSGSYFIARLKMIENLNTLKDYQGAEDNLRLLLEDYPENTQLLTDLGTIMSNMNREKEAIKIFQKAVKSIKNVNSSSWPVFYSLAVSYDRDNQKAKAEENLLKALELSNRHPNVLNYLGYTWLTMDKNVDQAAEMILEAYKQYPYDGHIVDSLGWLFYRLGWYEKAVEYLEQASDMNPGNAVISDHLGDAYWFGGRKNEAVFQWKHALDLKEDAESVDKDAIRRKIEDAQVENKELTVQSPSLYRELRNM